MKRLLIFLVLSGVLQASGSSPQQLLKEANDAYARSEYKYAITLYEQVLEKDLVAAQLYYNLGNAYFKNNQMGPAILNYERALMLTPFDENVRHNLQVAQSRIIDKPSQRPLLFYEKWLKAAYMMQSVNGWAITAIVVTSLFLLATALYLFSKTVGIKKLSFYSALLLLLLSVLSMVFARKQYNRLTSNSEAIVMQTRVTAKSSPSVQSPDLFLMHEGTKVTVRNDLTDWYEISLPDGSVGWVKNETIEII